MALKARGAGWPRPVPGRSAVQEAAGPKVSGAEGSPLQAPVASGAIWTNVSEPAFLSSVARYATLRRPVETEQTCNINKYRAIN